MTTSPVVNDTTLLTLRLTGAAPVAAPTEPLTWGDINHIFCRELSRREPALSPGHHKLLKSLPGCETTSDDPVKARQELEDAFDRMTAEHAEQRSREWEARYGSGDTHHGGSVNYTRASMATSVPQIPKARDVTSPEWERARAERMGLSPPPTQTKAITR